MKTLGLLRHAKSDMDDLALRDFDRGLNDRGRRGAAVMGGHIRANGVAWGLLLASPAERVRRTLEAARLAAPVEWNERIYLADSDALIEILRRVDGDPAAVLVAGHNPGLQELVFALVAPEHENDLFGAVAEKFPTATFAVLELEIDRWGDCAPGCGRLVHLARPRDLDPELGPEAVR
ncbi:MAG TPA: histidine phosphatase family protein [Croceibacterium sp.]|nr:histidine phosphatase family protein [Croceibacterium sp.]